MSGAPDDEARRAAAVAVAALGDLGKRAGDYRLTHLENALQGAGASPTRWRVGFKLRELIPEDASEIGKGGDFFVTVDLATSSVTPAKGGH